MYTPEKANELKKGDLLISKHRMKPDPEQMVAYWNSGHASIIVMENPSDSKYIKIYHVGPGFKKITKAYVPALLSNFIHHKCKS